MYSIYVGIKPEDLVYAPSPKTPRSEDFITNG